MELLLLGLGLFLIVLVFAMALARIAGLSDEALGYKPPTTRRTPPRGWD